MERTVGLDFGTHQTKICVFEKEGTEKSYRFIKFNDSNDKLQYTLPSIVGIKNDGLIDYGYLPKNFKGKIIRYFKQGVFKDPTTESMYHSIWYIAYIIFLLEEKYGMDFTIQMGAPTGSESNSINKAKRIATQIIASAYNLVEEVYKNDLRAFLSTPIERLKKVTTIIEYSPEIKKELYLQVFPEAYACLRPLVSNQRIETGMNLMVDIGGGTTDISFFTIEKKKDSKGKDTKEYEPQVYAYYSLDKGLNYLIGADETNTSTNYSKEVEQKKSNSSKQSNSLYGYVSSVGVKLLEALSIKEEQSKPKKLDSNVDDVSEIIDKRKEQYFREILAICNRLQTNVENLFIQQVTRTMGTSLQNLRNALQDRPIVYCGGGSTFKVLRKQYRGFVDKKHVSHSEWRTEIVVDMNEIREKKLCPILSTAYGLSIPSTTDLIRMKSLSDLFKHLSTPAHTNPITTTSNDMYSNASTDWDTIK